MSSLLQEIIVYDWMRRSLCINRTFEWLNMNLILYKWVQFKGGEYKTILNVSLSKSRIGLSPLKLCLTRMWVHLCVAVHKERLIDVHGYDLVRGVQTLNVKVTIVTWSSRSMSVSKSQYPMEVFWVLALKRLQNH